MYGQTRVSNLPVIPAFAGTTEKDICRIIQRTLKHKRKVIQMLDKELLDILACPKCKGELEYDAEKETLTCHECHLKYKVEDGIPNMLIDEA